MRGKWILVLAVGGLLAACAQSPAPSVHIISAPFADGREHKEPVFYNDHMYAVTYRFDAGAAAYKVRVARQGRAMKAGEANQKAAEAIATSSLSHFACPTKKRAQILPGSLLHDGAAYSMNLRCGG
jgi:hypothetical protein